MTISTKALRAHIKRRDLISLRRTKIDDQSIQGFVLDCSEWLILLQYVYDFHLDGFMVLRRPDITELKTKATDRFQRQLLLSEGVLDQVEFSFRAPIQSFDSFLASRASDEIVIVEDEVSKPDRFLIGTVSHLDGGIATIRHFTGVARLVEPPENIPINQITSCQTRTNYSRFYERHFERFRQIHR
jgi:hypothetical protein